MAQYITKNFHALKYAYHNSQFNGIVLEGGSRSRKTWSAIEFIIDYCQNNTGSTINIVKETFASFKTTLYDDFKRIFQIYGINTPFDYAQEIKSFNLLGNKINLLGTDKVSKTHGIGSDIFWVNEGLEISQDFFDQFEQRCREFWIIDYNPYFTQHWIYDKILNRPDVYHYITTLLDNPYVSENEKRKILSYNPDNLENIKNGTADDFMWKVYGLGQRGEREGLIHKNVTYIDKFPDIDYWYGLDFGFTVDPSALVKIGMNNTIVDEIKHKNIYFELLCYEPTETPELLDAYMETIGIEKIKPITADSADKYSNEKGTIEMVRDLKKKNWKISKVSKTKTVIYWIGKMNEYHIYIIKNNLVNFARKEQESYRWKMINGIKINQPIDEFDHFWNAARYGFMASFKPGSFVVKHN